MDVRARIRVLHVIGSLDIGGTEGQLVELATRLDPACFDVTVCCLSHGGPHAEALAAAGVQVEIVGLRRATLWRRPNRLVGDLLRLIGFVRRARPDVVHGFLYWGYVLGALAGRAARVPAIVAGRRGLSRLPRADPRRVLERWALRMTDLVVANSEAVRQDVLQSGQVPTSKVLVVRNGVAAHRFAGTSDGAPGPALAVTPGAPVIGVVANLRRCKGVDIFLAAWREVVRHFPKATALLAGDGPLREALERRAAELDVAASVRFLGTCRDVPALLSLVDLVVHPSFEEGLPNAVLEAMAAGKAVVATDVGGTSEAVLDGETGRLVPARDAAALAHAMLWCLRHPGETACYGEAARRRAREHFAIEAMVGRYAALYRQLTENGARGPHPRRFWSGAPAVSGCGPIAGPEPARHPGSDGSAALGVEG
jgi:glycosyltransferase involved in cell wall biosynthesis